MFLCTECVILRSKGKTERINGVEIFTHAATITESIASHFTYFDYAGRKSWVRKVNNLRFEEFEKQKQIFALKFSNYPDRMSSFKYE